MSLIRDHVQFAVINERRSSYFVKNGMVLNVINLVQSVSSIIDGDGTVKARVRTMEISYTVTPRNIKRYDIDYTQGDATEQHRIKDLQFDIDVEPINIYETRDHLVLLSTKINKIILTDKVDEENNLILLYLLQVYIRTVENHHPHRQKICQNRRFC